MQVMHRTTGGDLCCRGIFLEMMGGEPVDGGGDSIGKSKGLFELGVKVSPGAENWGDGSKDCLVEGSFPGEGGTFGHVRQCECNLLGISPIDLLAEDKVEGDSV